MKRFKNILVVFDSTSDNQALFEHAVDLAQRNQASLTVIDVLEEAPSDLLKQELKEKVGKPQRAKIPIIEEILFDTPISHTTESPVNDVIDLTSKTTKSMMDIQEYIKMEEQSSIEKFVDAIQRTGILVNSKTIYGIPFIKIIQEVLRNQNDLVMITADGKGGLKEMLFGNTTMHLMRKCPCPVWVIKPGQPKQFRRILAAVDMVQGDEDRAALNTKIIELATSLARYGKSELLIIHAWRMYGESVLKGRGGFSTEEVNKLVQETKDTHRQWLIELLEKHALEDLKSEVYLLKGEAGSLIPELAQAKATDLIVMGTVSRTGIAGLLIGNTAEKVLQQINCSILTVKPEGFDTPVKLDPA